MHGRASCRVAKVIATEVSRKPPPGCGGASRGMHRAAMIWARAAMMRARAAMIWARAAMMRARAATRARRDVASGAEKGRAGGALRRLQGKYGYGGAADAAQRL
ncbi:hypothetical protein FGB62_1g124 [Gracilaria domingensis]|nr:hypothetical protein FGB62_1g124 [Gracilaria domingensis]